MGDTRIEALDNSLFDKLQVFDGDISPMLEPDNNAIAIAVSLDDYAHGESRFRRQRKCHRSF